MVVAEVPVDAVVAEERAARRANGASKRPSDVAPEELQGELRERFPEGKDPRDRDARVIPALLAEEVGERQRLVDPRERVEVHEVDLAELRLEFADLDEQVGRKAGT